jgi:pyruvate/2-oxoglutarate/acetoin dehydrogenase E1 component
LKAEHPLRVHDYPPDETTLVGAGMGLSQVGFVPVVELPYAKYLDCGADIFQESLITHWLSDGTQRNGMVYRLQGFDKGVFGGNFHTHNILPFVSSPGLDVMCHSNGANYVKAMRYAYRQAQAGRVVMSVDCTDLLNKRHLRDEDKDGYFLHTFPASEQGEEMSFDEVDVHRLDKDTGKWCAVRGQKAVAEDSSGEIDVVIVTYGNGVPTAMRAAQALMSPGKEEKQRDEKKVPSVAVVDSPYLSAAPAELKILLQASSTAKATVVFADICKQRMGPLSAISVQLHNEQILKGRKWTLVGAADTYNPLGNLVTFLSEADIEEAVNKVI